jgi:2-methylisocitrate lyase-like PEP mutase family enzyme
MPTESGYGKTGDAVGQAIERTIKVGAIGWNLEDSFPENGALREFEEQVERIRDARKAADRGNVSYFINARTDVFFQAPEGCMTMPNYQTQSNGRRLTPMPEPMACLRLV